MFRRMMELTASPKDLGVAFANANVTGQAQFLAAMSAAIAEWPPGDWEQQCKWLAKQLQAHPSCEQLTDQLTTLLNQLQAGAPAPAAATAPYPG